MGGKLFAGVSRTDYGLKNLSGGGDVVAVPFSAAAAVTVTATTVTAAAASTAVVINYMNIARLFY